MELETVETLVIENLSYDKGAPPPEQTPDKKYKILKRRSLAAPPPEGSIAAIASSQWYISLIGSTLDLIDDLTLEESIEAVGIVNEEGKVKGIVVREQLFQLIGRPFGRDLLGRKSIQDIVTKVKLFSWTENIFAVAEQIAQKSRSIQYFILQDEQERYQGIFTSWDMMVFLSSITREDLALAGRIQGKLIQDLYSFREKNIELAFSTQMAKGIGGDFLGRKKIDEGRYLICLCDVAGKGVAAALISSTIAGMVESFNFGMGIKQFLILLNSFILHTFGAEKYVTGLFLEVNTLTSVLTVYDLGHGHMAFVRNKKIASLKSPVTNPPLGILPSIEPKRFQFTLEPSDTVCIYSDGLTEQESSQGTSYSLDRTHSLLTPNPTHTLESIIIRLWEDFHTFRGLTPQSDDVSIVFIRRVK